MEIDKGKILEKLNAMSDDELRNIIKTIATSAGVSERKADAVLKDVTRLRRGFDKMSEKQISHALDKLDPSTVEKIRSALD